MTEQHLAEAVEMHEAKQRVELAHGQLEELFKNTEGKTPHEIGNIVGSAVTQIAKHGAAVDVQAILQIVQARSLQTLRTVRQNFASI